RLIVGAALVAARLRRIERRPSTHDARTTPAAAPTPTSLSIAVVPIHRRINSLRDRALDRLDGALDTGFEQLPLVARWIAQHPPRDVLGFPRRLSVDDGPPDPDADARELLAARLGDDVGDTLLPAAAALPPQPHLARRQVEVIAHD